MKLVSSPLAGLSGRYFVLLACAVVCAIVVGGPRMQSIIAADGPSAEEILKLRGLQRVGQTWCLPEEAELRERLNGLVRFEQRLVGAQQLVDQIVEQNELYHLRLVQFEQLEKKIRDAVSASQPSTAQLAALNAQIKRTAAAVQQLRQQYIPAAQFGLSPPLKPALTDLVIVRTDLMIRLLPMREAMDHLTQSYDALHHDRAISSAIGRRQSESLGPSHSLREAWKIVDKLQPMLFSDSLPVCRDGRFYRVTAIVNERQPLTFSYVGTGGAPTLIPQNLAEAAGLTFDEHAPKTKLRVASGREEMAWRTKVPQLRFGRHVLRDVDAYILAPEAADIGARIGAAAFAGYHVQLDADHLRLTIGK